MKKIPILLIALTLGLEAWAFNGIDRERDPSAVRILPGQDEGVFNLLFVQDQHKKVRIRIYNASGTLLHEERIFSNGGFKRPYNLSSSGHGVYRFEIQDGDAKIIRQVLYTEVPKVGIRRLPNNRVSLSVAGVDSDELTVEFRDGVDNLIFTEQVVNDGGFSKVYDLSKVAEETLIIRVKDQRKVLGSMIY